mgnify:CR=1 FL=1
MRLFKTLSQFFLPLGNNEFRQAWWEHHRQELEKAHAQQIADLQSAHESSLTFIRNQLQSDLSELKEECHLYFEQEKEEIANLRLRLQDRKEELARANAEYRTQIRLIEAKASPSNIWSEAVSTGFKMAWDMMSSLQAEGLAKISQQARDGAIRCRWKRIYLCARTIFNGSGISCLALPSSLSMASAVSLATHHASGRYAGAPN